jgi:hypothetical protein
MTKQTQIIQPLLNWVIDCQWHVVPASEPESRGYFTKRTQNDFYKLPTITYDLVLRNEPKLSSISGLSFWTLDSFCTNEPNFEIDLRTITSNKEIAYDIQPSTEDQKNEPKTNPFMQHNRLDCVPCVPFVQNKAKVRWHLQALCRVDLSLPKGEAARRRKLEGALTKRTQMSNRLYLRPSSLSIYAWLFTQHKTGQCPAGKHKTCVNLAGLYNLKKQYYIRGKR